MEEEELLILSDSSVIALRCLLEELLVFGHLLGVGEGDTVDALQTLVVLVSEEVG